MINIKRISNAEYSFKDSDKIGVRQVAEALTFSNPSDYAISSTIQKFNRNRLTFPVGMITSVQKFAQEQDIEIKIEDYLSATYKDTI